MTGLSHAHGSLRWIVLALLILAIVKGFKAASNGKDYTPKDDKINLFAMIAFHTQVLIGLLLYFLSDAKWYQFNGDVMGDSYTRFFSVEHIFGMLLAMALITMGRSKSKKLEIASEKHKKIAVFYLIGLIITLISIPWPFKEGFGHLGWF